MCTNIVEGEYISTIQVTTQPGHLTHKNDSNIDQLEQCLFDFAFIVICQAKEKAAQQTAEGNLKRNKEDKNLFH
jgi:hypothetical protein